MSNYIIKFILFYLATKQLSILAIRISIVLSKKI